MVDGANEPGEGLPPDEGDVPTTPPAEEPDRDDSPEEERSPWTTELIRFLTTVEDEVMAVLLGGTMVGSQSVGLGIAAPFLFRLHELVHAVASAIAGRQPGARGSLPEVPHAGLLALAGVEWDRSVTFHFGLGPGEELRLDSGSITGEAIVAITNLLVSTAVADDQGLYATTRHLGARVGVNYVTLINALEHDHVNTLWRTTASDGTISLPATRLRRAKFVLEQHEPPEVLEETIEGLLYRADSKEHKFILEPVNRKETKLVGTYDVTLREEIRKAWGKRVRARILTTHYYLARQVGPSDVTVELIEIIDVLGDE